MLRTISSSKRRGRTTGARFAIVASRYNAKYVDAMLRAARSALTGAGAARVEVWRVPGAFEMPAIVARLASRADATRPAAIVCLGVIIQGETEHARLIGEAVTQALAAVQVRHGVPVVHGVLLVRDEAQARVRCLGRRHNRGLEAAQTALEMARVMSNVG